MCLPTWSSVIGYEENRDKVMKRLRTGYPRFFKHAAIERLVENAKAECASDDEEVLVLPTRNSASKAHRWIERRAECAVRITSFKNLHALVVPAKAKDFLDRYWRYTGEVVSSRQGQDALEGTLQTDSKSHLVSRSLSKIYGTDVENIHIFSSGMSAQTSVLRALHGEQQNKRTLQIEFPYVDCLKVQEVIGNGVVYLNEAKGESFDEALKRIRQGEFAGVFTEVPSNPLLRTIDVERVAQACREGGTPLIIDDSTASAFNVNALKFADVVTGSLTKWISGAGDVMAGLAVVNPASPFADQFANSLIEDARDTAPLYIRDAEVLLSNMKGFAKRMRTINKNGREVAAWLSNHPAVKEVWHPSLTCTEEYKKVKREGGGYGGLLSFILKAPKKTPKFYDALAMNKGPSFGTNFTLVCPFVMLAHYHELDWAEGCGVSRNLIRISTGTEPLEQLIAALEGAFAAI